MPEPRPGAAAPETPLAGSLMEHSTRRNILANYAGQGAASLLSLALMPVYIAYIGIEAYALVGLFAVIQAWLALLDLGMAPTLGREMARFRARAVSAQFIGNLLRSLEAIYLGMGFAVAVGLTLSAEAIAAHWLRAERLPIAAVAGALSMLGGVVGLRFCEGLYRSALMGLQQQVWVNVAGTGLAVVRSVGALAVLAFVAPTVQAFFVWQALVSLVTLAVFATRLHRSLPRPPAPARFSAAALIEVRHFAGGIFGITLLGLMITQLDKLLLSRLLTLTDFGYYLLAATIAAALYIVSAPIGQGMAPVLVRLVETGDTAALSAAYHKASQLLTVLLVPAVALLALFPGGVLLAWSGDPLLAARTAPILALLALGTFASAQFQLPYQLQMAAGWTGLILRLNIAAVLVLVPALLWAVPRDGVVAAAVVSVALNLGYLLIGIPLLHRRLLRGEMWQWYRADVGVPAAAALAACLPLLIVVRNGAPGRLEWLALLAATGLGSVAAAALAADRIRPEVLALLRRLIGRR
jgi:O-antigen/teichoic acid export membrane protein